MTSTLRPLVRTATAFVGLALVAGVASAQAPTFVTQWGSLGSGAGQFSYPEGIATDASGHVYVTDNGNSRVQKFDNNGAYLGEWGSPGTGNGQFNFPDGIATDAAGNVYVVDCYNNRVEKFTNDGAFLTQWCSLGNGVGQFNHPRGIAVDAAGNVFVGDQQHNAVEKFDGNGVFLARWNSPTNDGGLCMVGTDGAGNVYAANCACLIIEFSASGDNLAILGSCGTGDGELRWPAGIKVDALGELLVADLGNNRIQEFDASGQWRMSWGSLGSGIGQFNQPTDIAIDKLGNIFILDRANNRVQKFSMGPTPVKATSWGQLKASYR